LVNPTHDLVTSESVTVDPSSDVTDQLIMDPDGFKTVTFEKERRKKVVIRQFQLLFALCNPCILLNVSTLFRFLFHVYLRLLQ